MADKKISELDAITGANTAATDVFVVVDTSTGQTRKITREELNNAIEQDVLSTVDINGGTIDGTTIGGTTAAAGSFTTVDATGNITVGGTVDGRDVAADGTKLDGIDAGATADQSGAEIATALNGETISSLTALTTTGAVIVGGDLTVNGTTTTINSTTLEVDDKNIVLASGAADAAAANGSGITIDGANATFTYASTGDKWTFNKPIDVTGDVIASGDLTVDTNTLHVDSANNRVGIGTASPVAAMQIKTQTNGNAAFQNSTSVSGGVKINAFNDAANASVPFELDGSTLQFNISATEKMRLDSSGVLVGKTSADGGVAGFEARNSGETFATASGTASLYANRLTNNGDITVFQNAGSTVGSVAGHGGKLQIGQGNANVQFSNADDAIIPTNGSGTVNDNALDLGTSSARFNDIHYGGVLNANASDYQIKVTSGSNQPWYLRSLSNGSFGVHLNGTGDIANFTSSGASINGDLSFGDGNKAIFGDDADISIYHSGSSNLIHSKSDLNVGKGVTGGSFVFRLSQPSGAGGNTLEIDSNSTGGHQRINAASTNYPLEIQYGGVTRLSINSTGATIGDGTDISMSSTSAGQLRIDGNGYDGAIALNANGMHIYHNSSSRYMSFGINETEEMRLETDGDLHVDGNVVAYSTTISDIRLKKDIAPIEDAVTKVQQLNGCTFTYLKDDRKSAGLIAQDVEKVLPSAVIDDEAVFHGEEGETYKTVQYDQVIGLLVEAIKELKAEIEELKNASAE